MKNSQFIRLEELSKEEKLLQEKLATAIELRDFIEELKQEPGNEERIEGLYRNIELIITGE